MNDSDRHRLAILRGDPTRHGNIGFSGDECTESYLLKDCRKFSQNDQRILQEGFGNYYVQGLTPKLMYSLLCREFNLAEEYTEIALREDVRNFSLEKRYDQFFRERKGEFLLSDDDVYALDAFTESKGVDIRQFVHRLVALEPKMKNKLMLREKFRDAVVSAKTYDELMKINSRDIRWIPGLEGYCFKNFSHSTQHWFGRKNMGKYRKLVLVKLLELMKNLNFEESTRVTCDLAQYSGLYEARYFIWTSEFEKLGVCMLIHFDGRQELIKSMFKVCLAKATFDQCLTVYSKISNKSVSSLAIAQMDKLAKTAEQHWTVAQIAHRRKNTKLWKRHLKKAAAKA